MENSVSNSWSPNGSRLALGRTIIDGETWEVLLTIPAQSGVGGWSPDGKNVLAWADETRLGLFDSTTGDLLRTIPVGDTRPDAVSWSPTGEYLILIQPTGVGNVINAENGQHITTIAMEHPIGLRWSPDGHYLAAAFAIEVEEETLGTLPNALSPTIATVFVWEVSSGRIVSTFSELPALPLHLRWHPSNPELVGAAGQGIIYVWNLETNLQNNIFTALRPLTSIEYSPFGGRLLIGSWIARQGSYANRVLHAPLVRWSQEVIPDTLEIVVPVASVERLNEIAAACAGENQAVFDSMDALTEQSIQAEALSAFITQIQLLPEDALPLACADDLIAVASALSVR